MQLTVDGRTAYAYTGGKEFDTSRPVVVFIHGAQNDHSVWGLQSRYLAHHGYGVLALDLPGHGRSAGPALTSVEAMADWLMALLDALGVERAALVGHSMGSLIALESAFRRTAADAADRIASIALVATAYPMNVSDALLDAARHDEHRAIEMISIWSHTSAHGGYSHKPSSPGPGFGLMWGSRRLMQRQAPGVLLTDFSACNAYANGAAAAAALTCPTLFLLGERDSMTVAKAGRALAARIPHARVVVLPGIGHSIMGEAPDAALDALASHLAPMLRADHRTT